jgi:hypothetical protein
MLPGNVRTKNIENLHFKDHVLPPLMVVRCRISAEMKEAGRYGEIGRVNKIYGSDVSQDRRV